MRLHSYVVARDYGFAPNPFFGICTLATCKPNLRRIASIGDLIIGTGSAANNRRTNLVYAMFVTGAMTFDEYWNDGAFVKKRPVLNGSKKYAFGDNIYHRNVESRSWHQLNSHHSENDGTPNPLNVKNDTQTDRILYSKDFIYWGGSGPKIPDRFINYNGQFCICARRNHKNNFPESMVAEVVSWIRSFAETGFLHEPYNWRN